MTISTAPATTVAGVGTTVSAGTALELQGDGLAFNEGLTLAGLGFNNIPTGALRMADGAAGTAEMILWNAPIVMSAAALIGVAAAEDLLAQRSTSTLSGAFSLTKVGFGTLELGGTSTNSYTGGTFISEGTLLLNKQDTAGRPFQPNATGTGAITIGNEGGGTDGDVLRYGPLAGVDQIIGTASVLVTSSGLLDLGTNGISDSFTALTLETSRLQRGRGDRLRDADHDQ